MSTRSLIMVENDDKTIDVIYCHYDGYPSHHMPILTKNYLTEESRKALMNLGDISELAESPECPEGHTYSNSVKGYCVAYGRDRGEDETEKRHYKNINTAIKDNINTDTEHWYLWTENQWKHCPIVRLYDENIYNMDNWKGGLIDG